MSLQSMTGYGRGLLVTRGLRVEAEVSSVNRKQLDVQFTLPAALRQLESRIQEEVAKVVSRGRIVIDIAVRGTEKMHGKAVRVDEQVAAAYLKSLRHMAKKLKLEDERIPASLIATLPGVVRYEPLDEDVDQIWPPLQKALRQALKALVDMRAREGQALQVDLEKRLALLEMEVGHICKQAPDVTRRYRDALQGRLKTAGLDLALEDERLLKEIALFAERSDITEEVTRLQSHFAQARKLLRSSEPAGRALDFLAQEMYREINTIGSKANDAVIARHVVTFKAELDRLREQVQNIE